MTPDNLKIAENVTADPVAAPRTRRASRIGDAAACKIGTTKRGIGPAYEDKVGRRAIRLMDLAEPDELDGKIARLLAHHDPLRRGLGLTPPSAAAIRERTARDRAEGAALHGADLSSCSIGRGAPASASCSRARKARCSTSITAPIPSSPRPTRSPPTLRPDPGSGPRAIGYVLGIAKAYTTRVGGGPFPTELDDEIGRRIGQRGNEFGTNTGRPRRCGWFDAVLMRQAIKMSGIDGIALTKLDILDGFDEIKVCHRTIGSTASAIDYLPAGQGAQARGRTGLRDDRGLARSDRRRALMGRSARPGDQICSPDRRIDRRAGRAVVDQPRA